MGLDMYLERETYIGGQHHQDTSGVINIKFTDFSGKEKSFDIDPSKVTSINQSVGSWRKANSIHNFFVQRAQGGVDECQRTYVPNKLLIELRDTCKKILSARKEFGNDAPVTQRLIEANLMPTGGFFFGSTEINDWYFEDLELTLDILKDVTLDEGDYYYQSSW
jgi:hypothetical protein